MDEVQLLRRRLQLLSDESLNDPKMTFELRRLLTEFVELWGGNINETEQQSTSTLAFESLECEQHDAMEVIVSKRGGGNMSEIRGISINSPSFGVKPRVISAAFSGTLRISIETQLLNATTKRVIGTTQIQERRKGEHPIARIVCFDETIDLSENAIFDLVMDQAPGFLDLTIICNHIKWSGAIPRNLNDEPVDMIVQTSKGCYIVPINGTPSSENSTCHFAKEKKKVVCKEYKVDISLKINITDHLIQKVSLERTLSLDQQDLKRKSGEE